MIKQQLIRLHWLLSSQFGLDPLRFLRSLRGLLIYWREHRQFRRAYPGRMLFMPCLHDRFKEAGIIQNEYFWQDLLVARWIFVTKPEKHVDIGSRLDGFVAHVASFRDIEVFDIRPVTMQIPGVIFKQVDLTKPLKGIEGYCDSLSCLHALEHFGLGRYGDPIDPEGYQHGVANMAKLLKPGGHFCLSTPIGQERVEFNAHRVFDPRTIINLGRKHFLELTSMTLIEPNGFINKLEYGEERILELAEKPYSLGLFWFRKVSGRVNAE